MPPTTLPEFQIQNFLSRQTLSLPLSSLPAQDSSCPICHNSYASPPTAYVHPVCPLDIPEYPVEIQACKHVMGRHCLERHIRGGMPWSHTCPMCRVEWFNAPGGGRREVLGIVEGALDALGRIAGGELEEGVRAEVQGVERGLRRVRSVLGRGRWI